ncbi:immunoglobulin superfamily member 5 [Pseudophryne corroboree]|uniref:immunoglobulin superfamily member 5 n=1 Tax=Pseudophryne corroboree TaxID=495146 RepID=UPI003081289A
MDGERKTWTLITVLLCLVTDYGSCSEILQGPQNVTVLTGSSASFTCTVKEGWQSVSWYLADIFVVSITHAGTTVSSNNINARNSTNSVNGAFTSEITIINANKNNSGTVRCSSLSASFQDAYLTVQVNGSVQITNGSVTVKPNTNISMVCNASGWFPAPAITWKMNNTLASNLYYFTDYATGADSAVSTFTINPDGDMNLTCLASISTLNEPQSATVNVAVREQIQGSSSSLTQTDIILIAVFCSIGGLLLLIVIITIIVICCCKKKDRESSYQSDARKAPDRNGRNLRSFERDHFGENNFGYTPEPTAVEQSFHSNDATNSVYNEVMPTFEAYTSQEIAYNPSERAYTPQERAYAPPARPYTPQVPVRDWTDESLKQIRHVTHV